MVNNNKKVPEIRFKGFTEDWEQRKLKECFDERIENMPDGEMLSVTISSGIKKFSELGRHDNSNENKTKYKKVMIGDIAYNSMRMWQGASGYSSYCGIVSPAYTVLSPKNKIVNSKCISYLFKKNDMIHKFKLNSQGITSDNWNLKYPVLSEIEIYISKSLLEQDKISTVLISIDNLIAVYQRKYDKLINVKQSLLEKMFPKNNTTIPEIRFKGFTEDWEQRKLSDYLDVSNEKNENNIYKREDVLSVSGEYGIVNQIEFQGRSFAGTSVIKYGIVYTNDVVYTKSPLNFNPYGIIKTNKGKTGIVSTLYAIYHPKSIINPCFIQTYFEQNARMNNYMLPLVNKGAKNDMKVTAENALKGYVIFPKIKEQNRIYSLFNSIDNLITLHQRKLEKFNQIKSSLLEKMFI